MVGIFAAFFGDHIHDTRPDLTVFSVKTASFDGYFLNGAQGNACDRHIVSGITQCHAIDLKEKRLQMAKDLGARHVIQAKKPFEVDTDLVDQVKALTGGFGADVVVSAAGLDPTVLEESFQMSAKQGQVLYFAATLSDPVTLNLDVIHYKELRFIGTHDSTRADYEKAVALMQSGNIRLDSIISHRYALDDIYEAFSFAKERIGLKVMIVNDE